MNRIRRCVLVGLMFFASLHAGGALAAADDVYVIYLHGRIIEDRGPTPTHPEWGLYDYPAVVSALGSQGAIVKSEVREKDTNVYSYAGEIIRQIEALVAGGAKPSQIVVVGFSKGGVITSHVSSFLRRPEIRYVLLAACSDWLSMYPHLRLSGKVLSITETSDVGTGSCQGFAERNDRPVSFREIEISTGKDHGAFYVPRDEWLEPVLQWVHEN